MSIHAKSWQVNIKNSRRLNSLTAGHMTSVDSSGSGVFCFFLFFQNLPVPPIHFSVFEVSADFPKF